VVGSSVRERRLSWHAFHGSCGHGHSFQSVEAVSDSLSPGHNLSKDKGCRQVNCPFVPQGGRCLRSGFCEKLEGKKNKSA
jgi:hypothetical protein